MFVFSKSKFFVAEEKSGLHKGELLKYHENLPILVFEGSLSIKMAFFFFNCDSLHARLNSHSKAWSYKKGSTKKRLQDTENLFKKNLQLKDVC